MADKRQPQRAERALCTGASGDAFPLRATTKLVDSTRDCASSSQLVPRASGNRAAADSAMFAARSGGGDCGTTHFRSAAPTKTVPTQRTSQREKRATNRARCASSSKKKEAALSWAHEPTGTSAHRLRRTWWPPRDSRGNCRLELATVTASGAYAPSSGALPAQPTLAASIVGTEVGERDRARWH